MPIETVEPIVTVEYDLETIPIIEETSTESVVVDRVEETPEP